MRQVKGGEGGILVSDVGPMRDTTRLRSGADGRAGELAPVPTKLSPERFMARRARARAADSDTRVVRGLVLDEAGALDRGQDLGGGPAGVEGRGRSTCQEHPMAPEWRASTVTIDAAVSSTLASAMLGAWPR